MTAFEEYLDYRDRLLHEVASHLVKNLREYGLPCVVHNDYTEYSKSEGKMIHKSVRDIMSADGMLAFLQQSEILVGDCGVLACSLSDVPRHIGSDLLWVKSVALARLELGV
jgi:hypothetical protein